jgi:N-acetylneuraminic acid mutarotase
MFIHWPKKTMSLELIELKTIGGKFPGICGHKMLKIGDNIFITGGFTSNLSNSNKLLMFVYNIRTNIMREVKIEGEILYYLLGFSIYEYKEKIVILLGLNNNTLIYDFKTNSVEKLEGENSPEDSYAQTGIIFQDSFIIFGGMNYISLTLSNETFEYSIENMNWNLLKCFGDIPSPRSFHSCVNWGDKLYYFGGIGGDINFTNLFRFQGGVHFNSIHCFDVITRTWELIETKNNLKPPCRRSHSASVLNDKMYIVAGHHEFNGVEKTFSDCWAYDFFLNSWSEISLSMNINPTRFHSHVGDSRNIWILGGVQVIDGDLKLLDTFYCLSGKYVSKSDFKGNLLKCHAFGDLIIQFTNESFFQ